MNFDEAVQAVVPANTQPVLEVRVKSCGCFVGNVYSTPAGFVIAGFRRAIVHTTADGGKHITKAAPFLNLLDQPDRPEDFGCPHRQGWLPIPALLEAARKATRRRKFLV